MSGSFLRLHFLSLLLLCCLSRSSCVVIKKLVACRPHEIRSFMQFKNEFDTRGCNHSDYSNGVWCDNLTGVITKLQLRAYLSGTLKPNCSLFGLHHLRYVSLDYNNFTSSSLPPECGNLNKLEVLSLSSNGFLGQVPSSFSNLSMLSFLGLFNNELTGSFPLLGNLTKLTVLELSHNHFSGTLKPNSTLFELHELRQLSLAYNNFSSELPSEFGTLNKLEGLALSSNDFFGQVPPTFSNLTWLTELYLNQNRLSGSFPLVQNLTKLSLLNFHGNYLSGTIHSSLFTMPFLSNLDLSENNLSGSIELYNSSTSSSLVSMYLGNNNFEGKIQEHIPKLINLKNLDISFIKTSNPINVSLFSSLKSLLYLDLSGNSISPASLSSNSDIPPNLEILFLSRSDINEFPNIIKILQKLEHIDISGNGIKGKLPEWLWNLPHLSSVLITNNAFSGFEGSTEVLVNSSVKYLDMQLNNFEGTIPILPLSINILAARGNRFTGSIPLSICNCRSLTHLSLSYNNLTGSIPQCLSNLIVVDLRKNNLEGSIPDTFSTCASLRTLNVGYNRLTGKLPRSFLNCLALEFLSVDHNTMEDIFPFWLKALPNLQVLILSSNHFHGPISSPHHGPLGFPELRIFEISDNKFTGSLPPSYFVNWKASSLTMNEDGGLYMEYGEIPYSALIYTYINFIDLEYKGLSMEHKMVLTSYATIDFFGNRLEGQIPESIGLLKALIALNLSNNAFTGHIPIPLSLPSMGKLEITRPIKQPTLRDYS